MKNQLRIDIQHSKHPEVGDTWYERLFTPICKVIGVTQGHVEIVRVKRVSSKHLYWDTNSQLISKADFWKFLHYDSSLMKSKFWCHCTPSKLKVELA